MMELSFAKEIVRYSRLIRAGVILVALTLAVASGCFFYAVLIAPDTLVAMIQRYLSPDVSVRLTPGVVLVLAVLGCINLVLIINGLLAIWRFCNHLEHGDIFATSIGANLREAGFYALACSVSQFFSRILAVLAVTINNPDGQRQLAIEFSSNMAFLLLISGLLLVMGHIMVIASQIDEENREFI